MNALIIEDDVKMSDFVRDGLVRLGYTCDCAFNGDDGYSRLVDGDYSIAIVDRMLPGLTGLEIIRKVRHAGKSTPIIVTTELGEVSERISGLNAGADDYLCKPFQFDELVARINAVQRRLVPAKGDTLLAFEDLVVNPVSKAVTRGGHEILLTHYEYQILEYMLRNRGRTVSPKTIMDRVWDINATFNKNLVEVRIHHLRLKLCAFGGHDLITTKRGLGYVLG